MKRILIIILTLSIGLSLFGQQHSLSNWRVKMVLLEKDTFRLCSLPIVPESVQIKDGATHNILSEEADFFSKNIQINYNQLIINDLFFLKNNLTRTDSLEITYRVFPFDFQKPVKHLDTLLIAQDYEGNYIGVDYTPDESTNSSTGLFNQSGLQYSGSFARGVSFGNSQNLVLNLLIKGENTYSPYLKNNEFVLIDHAGILYDYKPVLLEVNKVSRYKEDNLLGVYGKDFKKQVYFSLSGGMVVADLKQKLDIQTFMNGISTRGIAQVDKEQFLINFYYQL